MSSWSELTEILLSSVCMLGLLMLMLWKLVTLFRLLTGSVVKPSSSHSTLLLLLFLLFLLIWLLLGGP